MDLIQYSKWFYDEEREEEMGQRFRVRLFEDVRFPDHEHTEASEVTVSYISK